jgi:WD40 repeat protein/mono/diheme cytochrome c family protein
MSVAVFRTFAIALSLVLAISSVRADDTAAVESEDSVSFYKQIRPIFQAQCHGCHQPARSNGEYVMTEFSKLVAGGESETAAIVPENLADSYLLELITPTDGEATMPKGKKPLSQVEIDLIKKWINEGAVDDTPEGAKRHFDAENPPIYTRPPVITSIDFSPDGQLLAVAGFHEVLLSKADGSELVARLIGVSERIESVKFSPDGKRLLVTGGLPGRMGEVQVWDVAERKLVLSVPVTYDTIYGGDWSPDGTRISFGCSDKTVRAIDSKTGEQILYQGAHSDWIRDTAFSHDGSHVVSVARDMTVKLTEVETNRFIDNITSITPKALKGGVNAVVRHPDRDEIVVGGADGVPKVYRMFRITARKIGDDSNLIRNLNPMRGRVFGVAVSRDGKRIAAVSSLNGQGELAVYSYEFDTKMPGDLKKIAETRVQSRKPADQKKLDDYRTKDIKRIAQVYVDDTSLFAVAFSPDGTRVAITGGDGKIRVIETETGKTIIDFSPAPITAAENIAQAFEPASPISIDDSATYSESLPEDAKIIELAIEPAVIELGNKFAYAQLLVTATMSNGQIVDATRIAKVSISGPVAEISPSGFVSPKQDGTATLVIDVNGTIAEVPITVAGFGAKYHANFVRDVSPLLSRLGCNAGTCHGAAKGKNGFQLSLRGYDPIVDVRAFTDDLKSRRTNIASPDDSLMLLKSTGAVPHVGGQVVRPGEPYYQLIRNWLAGGAKLDTSVPGVSSIEILPMNPTVQAINAKQQFRVIATYSDGTKRDVTREAFIVSGNTDSAEVNRTGLMTALRRGESPVLARFEGSYAATTLTVMGNRDGFEFKQPDTWGPIDVLTAAKWQRMKIQPSELCNDTDFLRRVHIDLTGLPPTAEAVKAFVADDRETQIKRGEVVDTLIGNNDYVEYWTNKWADLLQVNRKYLGPEGAKSFRDWIRNEVDENTPYNQFVKKIITASGSNKENPQASYYKILREPEDIMENTTHLFLAVRFNCNKCHDHPFERWTQDQYYETAAFFARVSLKADPAAGKRKIGGTAVEGAKPFYEIVGDKKDGEVTHQRTGQISPPEFPFACDFETEKDASRREQMAAWIISADNQYFAKSYVNRLWGYLFGIGIIEPIDDIRASNPPTNPELLDYLAKEFIKNDFNARHVLSLICKSRTYQLALETNKWNEDDNLNYSHSIARRLPAEVLYDAIHQVTGSTTKIPGVPPGTRAAAIPDSGIRLTDGFLANLGRPPRESACECERVSDIQLGPVMALISGPTVANAIADKDNAIAKLVASEADDEILVNELFLRVLNRPARKDEFKAFNDWMALIDGDHQALTKELADRGVWWKQEKPVLEKKRVDAIGVAKGDLEAYQKEIAPRIAEEEKKRQAGISAAEANLKKYKDNLPQHVTAWEKRVASTVEWHLLEPGALAATKGIKLQRQADRSVRAVGDADKSAYTINVNTSLRGITGFRIEALLGKKEKGVGPGILENGNFVVTEFEVQAATKSKPDEMKKVALQNAKADHLQAGFKVALAIDGNAANQNAWAIGDGGGVVHWATFETKQPLGFEEGTVLKFVIHQNHVAKKHLLSRFRISVTTDKKIGLSLPEQLKAIVSVPADQRDDAQKEVLTTYFSKTDTGLTGKRTAVATAKKPLPEDPGVTKRNATLKVVSKTLAEDRRLVQLRKDIEFSAKQLGNKRLTAAQDLTWALINNPSFLFNH